MGATSKIEWTGRSDWNPIRGCTRVSPGCGGPGVHGGCYAEAIAGRFSGPGHAFHGFATRTNAGARWTGRVEVQWERLTLPLSWRKPAVIFANSMSDVFHEALPMDQVAQIYGVAVAAHHLRGHTTQIVTKRAGRAGDLLNDPDFWDMVNAFASAHVIERVDPLDRRSDDARATLDDYGPENPPPGVWLGVSVENQQWADKRRSAWRAVPAVIRFVSYEPALGPVDWTGWEFIDWMISGGESGPRARPGHPDWFRETRDFCGENEIAYLHKQNGEFAPGEIAGAYLNPNRAVEGMSYFNGLWTEEWSEVDGHCDDEPDTYRVGKKAAGRLLDGVQHDGMPS